MMNNEELISEPVIDDPVELTEETTAPVTESAPIDPEAVGRAWAESQGWGPKATTSSPTVAAPVKQSSTYDQAVEEIGNTYDTDAINRRSNELLEDRLNVYVRDLTLQTQMPSIQLELEARGVPKEVMSGLQDAMNIARSIPGLDLTQQKEFANILLKGVAADKGLTTVAPKPQGTGTNTPKGGETGTPTSPEPLNMTRDQKQTWEKWRKTQGYSGPMTKSERAEVTEFLGYV